MVSTGSVKFLRIFLKQKTTKYSVLFIWNIAFETLVICEVEIVFWKEMLLYYFRQVFWHQYAQRFLSLSFEVPHTLKYPSGCTQQCFLVAKKNTQSREIVVPKIQQIMFLTFSSYSINILPNYLIFLTQYCDTIFRLKNHCIFSVFGFPC